MRIATILTTSLFVMLAIGTPTSTGDSTDGDAQFMKLLAEKNELLRSRQQGPDDARVTARLRRVAADFKAFLRDHPQHIGAMVSYGALLYEQKNEDEAVKWWLKAIAAPATRARDAAAHAHAYNNLGQHYGENGRAVDALRYHQKASELAPEEPMFHFN